MKPEEVEKIVGKTPFTSPERCRQLYDFIIQNGTRRCLELGFAHGSATTWIAAALDELGCGRIVAVDNESALKRQPSARDLLKAADLERYVDLNFEPHSYTWHLMRNLERYSQEPFDFVFLDGAHTWDTDGFAFLLVEPMLSAGGWILFDDLNWTFDQSPSLKGSHSVASMPEEIRTTPQIRMVWEKLVLPNPRFSEFREVGNWGWAKKIAASEVRDFSYVRENVARPSTGRTMIRRARKLLRSALRQ